MLPSERLTSRLEDYSCKCVVNASLNHIAQHWLIEVKWKSDLPFLFKILMARTMRTVSFQRRIYQLVTEEFSHLHPLCSNDVLLSVDLFN